MITPITIKTLTLYFLIGIALFACQANSSEKKPIKTKRSFPQLVKVIKTDSIKLELDSLTSNYIACLQYHNENGTEELIYLNEETGCIYINDLVTNKIIGQITPNLPVEKRKKKFQGFYYHNKDSIFLFAFAPKILLMNNSGNIINTYETTNIRATGSDKIVYQALYVSTRNMPVFFNNNMYVNCVVLGNLRPEEQRKVQLMVNTYSKKVSLGRPYYPEEYYKDFGGMDYYVYSTAHDPILKNVVYSYPAMDSILVLSLLNNEITKVYAGSKYVESIPEFEKSKYKNAVSKIEGEYFMRSPSYGPILYDQYKDIFYRLAFLPEDQENAIYEIKDAPTKQISVMVFDKQFNYLGENLLEKNKYWPNSVFVSKAGLHIQKKNEADETLDFDVFVSSYK